MFPQQLLDNSALTQGQKRTSPLSRDTYPEMLALPPAPSSTPPGVPLPPMAPAPMACFLCIHRACSTSVQHLSHVSPISVHLAWPQGTWLLRMAFPGHLGSGGPTVYTSLSLSSVSPCLSLSSVWPWPCLSPRTAYNCPRALHRMAHVPPRALHSPPYICHCWFGIYCLPSGRLQFHRAGPILPGDKQE